MLAERAFELVRGLKNSPDILPPFDEEGLRIVFEELWAQNELIRQDYLSRGLVDGDLPPEINVRLAGIERGRRCALAYVYNRLRRIRGMRWGFGSIVPAEIKANLRETEARWLDGYGKQLATYMCAVGLDLTQDTQPPSVLYRQVICKEDFGEFETSEGDVVLLKVNSFHMLPDEDADALLQRGIVADVREN